MSEVRSCAGLLAAIEAIQSASPDISLPGVVLFLHVCENDGISIKDLVFVSGYSESLVSRAIERLCGDSRNLSSGSGLLSVTRHPQDGRRRLVYLTGAGQQVKLRVAQALL